MFEGPSDILKLNVSFVLTDVVIIYVETSSMMYTYQGAKKLIDFFSLNQYFMFMAIQGNRHLPFRLWWVWSAGRRERGPELG